MCSYLFLVQVMFNPYLNYSGVSETLVFLLDKPKHVQILSIPAGYVQGWIFEHLNELTDRQDIA